MKKFKDKTYLNVAVWEKENVDTDIIIPSDYLKVIKKDGLGNYLFDSMRFIDDGQLGKLSKDRKKNKDFFLNLDIYKDAEVLIVGKNFGCGSSREHAPWAISDYGFKVVISESFANIFYENSFKNGLLLIELKKDEIKYLMNYYNKEEKKDKIYIDLENQIIKAGNKEFSFEINEGKKRYLISGLDEIGNILEEMKGEIKKFEKEQEKKYPFLYNVNN